MEEEEEEIPSKYTDHEHNIIFQYFAMPLYYVLCLI